MRGVVRWHLRRSPISALSLGNYGAKSQSTGTNAGALACSETMHDGILCSVTARGKPRGVVLLRTPSACASLPLSQTTQNVSAIDHDLHASTAMYDRYVADDAQQREEHAVRTSWRTRRVVHAQRF